MFFTHLKVRRPTFIIGFVFYLVASALFLNEAKTTARLIDGLSEKLENVDLQAKTITMLLSTFLSAENPESLYYFAVHDEMAGNPRSAAERLVRAIQLSQVHLQKYQLKLNQLTQR